LRLPIEDSGSGSRGGEERERGKEGGLGWGVQALLHFKHWLTVTVTS